MTWATPLSSCRLRVGNAHLSRGRARVKSRRREVDSMEALLKTFRDSYGKLASARERWDEGHAAATALLTTAVNAYERLPTLESATASTLGSEELVGTVVEAQYMALDRVFTRLLEECDGFDALVREMERAKTDAWARARGLNPPPKRAGGEKSGPQPSISDCVLGLEDAWVMYRDESALKREIVKKARTCEDIDDLKTMLRLFIAQANLDPEELRVIVERVPLKNVEAMR